MKIAIITLSAEGARLMARLQKAFPTAAAYVHEKVPSPQVGKPFSRMADLTAEVYKSFDALVFIAPCGAVVRVIAPHLGGKKTDPAVVQVDIGGRYAVSLLGGHEAGANNLAVAVANAIGAEPVISTSEEASKYIIAGVGCRKGKEAGAIVDAVKSALSAAGVHLSKVRLIASADVKQNETGLIEAARLLGVPVRFISSDEIKKTTRGFARSAFVEEKVGLPAVAEPSALLAGRRTTLLQEKRKYGGITVALAKEHSLSLE